MAADDARQLGTVGGEPIRQLTAVLGIEEPQLLYTEIGTDGQQRQHGASSIVQCDSVPDWAA